MIRNKLERKEIVLAELMIRDLYPMHRVPIGNLFPTFLCCGSHKSLKDQKKKGRRIINKMKRKMTSYKSKPEDKPVEVMDEKIFSEDPFGLRDSSTKSRTKSKKVIKKLVFPRIVE